ncbi:MAG: hypothetical protein ACYSWZ_00920 [Planctomycetota bacterium]|jgi:hypothetical protein
METATAIAIGVISMIAWSIAKALLDWDNMKPGVPKARRGRVLFRQMYLGPDFALLAIGLLVSFKGLQALLMANNVTSKLGDRLAFWFSSLMLVYITVLLLSILLWFIAGDCKYIPIEKKCQKKWDIDGTRVKRTLEAPNLWKGLTNTEGLLILGLGNFLGLSCISCFVLFAVKAF